MSATMSRSSSPTRYAQARDAAEKIVVDYGVLPAVVDTASGRQAGRAQVHDVAPEQHRLQLASRRQGRDRGGLRGGRARHQARHRQQPPDPQRDGAARRGRRLRCGHRRDHALHDEPEPACGAARAVGLHRHRARAQAARDRARRRRRLRLEDLHLRRGDGLRLGGQEGRPAGQMDRGPHRGLPVRRAWPRPRHPCGTGARRERQDHRPARPHDRQSRRLSVDLLVVGADLSLRAAAVGPVQHPRHLCEVDAVYTNTAPVDAYRGAGRPEATFLVERIVEVAARETGRDPAEFRRQNFVTTSRTRRRSSCATTPATIARRSTRRSRWPTTRASPARKAASAAKGKLRGVGFSAYIEACGIAPSAVVGSLGGGVGQWESAEVRVNPSGRSRS